MSVGGNNAALVDDILSIFTTNKDRNNEYTLRYKPWQTGNTRFAQEVLAFFPTRKNEKYFVRTDKAVAETTTNQAHLAQWRAKYGFLPPNTHALITCMGNKKIDKIDKKLDQVRASQELVQAQMKQVSTGCRCHPGPHAVMRSI